MKSKIYDIFISYSSLDKDIAFTLCSALEKEGLICWIAPRNISGGPYANSIVEAIENSKALVLIFSSNSDKSIPVLNELEIATNNKLLIIPVRIEEVLPTKSMKYYIMSNNWFDTFYPESVTDFENFTNTVKSTVNSNYTLTQRFITPTINKSKAFLPKSFTFIVLFFILIITMFNLNSFAKSNSQNKIIQQKDKIIEQQNKLIKDKDELLKEYQLQLNKYQNNPEIISQAEHIKDIAGYKEAIKYFKSNNKKLFYANYEKINILYDSFYNKYNNDNNQNIYDGVGSLNNEEYSLYIKTIPISAQINILNIQEKYKNNIYLTKGFYNIEIRDNGHRTIIFNLEIDKNTNITVELAKNSLNQEIK